MSSPLTFPQDFSIVEGLTPGADGAGRTGDYVSLKNAHKAFVVYHLDQGAVNTVLLSISESPLVSGVGAQAMTALVPIWSNQTCATTDAFVRGADAANFTTDANPLHKIVVFQIDPSMLGETFDCIAPVTGASNAGNITSCQIYLQQRYPQTTPPSAIID